MEILKINYIFKKLEKRKRLPGQHDAENLCLKKPSQCIAVKGKITNMCVCLLTYTHNWTQIQDKYLCGGERKQKQSSEWRLKLVFWVCSCSKYFSNADPGVIKSSPLKMGRN